MYTINEAEELTPISHLEVKSVYPVHCIIISADTDSPFLNFKVPSSPTHSICNQSIHFQYGIN
jgi:hypothetical protein